MAQYKVQFSNGSSDIVEADSAAEARERASEEFGRVKTVSIIEDEEFTEDDLDDDDAENEEDEDEGADRPNRQRK